MKEFLFSVVQWFVGLRPISMVIIILLTAIIITGTLFSRYYVNVENDKEIVIEAMQKELEECSRVRQEFADLKNDFILVRASQDQIPMPRWIKNLDLKMIWVNKAYEYKYLIPRGLTASEYISNFDDYAFDSETAAQYQANDRLVIRLNRPKSFIETYENRQLNVIKYPFKIGNTVFGVGGIEIETFE